MYRRVDWRSFIFRFNYLFEPFPDFLTPSDFMERHLLRQVKDDKKSITYQSQHKHHKKLFDLIDFSSNSITHLGRGSS